MNYYRERIERMKRNGNWAPLCPVCETQLKVEHGLIRGLGTATFKCSQCSSYKAKQNGSGDTDNCYASPFGLEASSL